VLILPLICLPPCCLCCCCPPPPPSPPHQALSNLSPWLHFGQLAPQRAALEAAKLRAKHRESVEGFLEELVRLEGVQVTVI
jgi:deoxyribodipyrimidine photolyase